MQSMTLSLGVSCVVLLAGCSESIWNAGDLAEWVRDQATGQGCVRDSIELEEWYREEASGNVWHGTCTDTTSGDRKQFSVNVDPVWTPSG